MQLIPTHRINLQYIRVPKRINNVYRRLYLLRIGSNLCAANIFPVQIYLLISWKYTTKTKIAENLLFS